MIRIFLGNPGSGKTACAVRELFLNPSNKTTFSNIITRKIKNNIVINQEMIIKKIKIKEDKKGKIYYDYKLNKDFWKNSIETYKSINVILDEAHTLLNARRSSSKINEILTDYLALLRRVLGSSDSGYGQLTLISQLERRIDIIAKEMCTHVRYHICHYKKTCKKCFYTWNENNEITEPLWNCPRCKSYNILKHDHLIEVYFFINNEYFVLWKYYNKKSYYKRLLVYDIEKYFPFYNTLQWDNLITEV